MREDGAKSLKKSPVTQDAVTRLAATDLLQGQRFVILEHEGAEYRLQLTSNNKLILTK